MGKQLDENKYNGTQWDLRKQKMKNEKKRQDLFRRVCKTGFIVIILTVIAAAAWEKGIKKVLPGSETSGKESFMTGESGRETEREGSLESAENESENSTVDEAGRGGYREQTVTEDDADKKDTGDSRNEAQSKADESSEEEGDGHYKAAKNTLQLEDEIDSSHAVLIDADKGTVLACKDETSRIVPASMTKVLTLLAAVENIKDFDDKFKITVEITDYCYQNGCSSAGFGIGEKVTVRDLMYGTVLPSGADAALGLAEYVAGSQKAFVKIMNEKLEELGLSKTAHFTNCVGIYDENHYCTVLDMAAIMKAAVENEICREVLSAHTYTTSKTKQHPDGISLSNWFLRRIEDKDTGGEVLCGKTGYVLQSGNCAVSYGADKKERNYICVTADAAGTWKCIYDHVYLYKRFSKKKHSAS